MFRFSDYRRVKLYFSRIIFRVLFAGSFKHFGSKVSIVSPEAIDGACFISLHDDVRIGFGAWLMALNNSDESAPELVIGNRVSIGRLFHAVSVNSLVIEDDVLIADKVYVSDNTHEFDAVDIPVIRQPVSFKGKVIIRKGAWIGEGVSILSSSIGKNSVVAAHSVVLQDVPDYCVVAGIPARVIKRFDPSTQEWRKTDGNGKFIYG